LDAIPDIGNYVHISRFLYYLINGSAVLVTGAAMALKSSGYNTMAISTAIVSRNKEEF